eukprot:CAMPEP_0119474370 /NCGR_PEP_ID=MMETSP1344-20130328/5643_1 /TAXON_ID=236787 /ORGANISM="Florenciella parvula, Strain CCMP2471" /LENGTH=621 /DNA_ID=CAMNT_0007507641 /DNA_START=85 /DNA_END=1950 /DNA_ORIENTATION=-
MSMTWAQRCCCGCVEYWNDMDDEGRMFIKIVFIFITSTSIIPAVALGIGTDDDDDAGGYAVNNTTFVEYETGAFGKVLHHFYDEECLAEDPELYKRTAKMLLVFVQDLRIENQLLTLGSLAATVAIAQLGGIPTPKLGSKLALATWSVWMVSVAFQFCSTLLALVMACESYTVFAAESRECMVPLAAGSDLARLNVIAALTFFVQPVFLVKLLLMFFYVAVAVEGLKVFARARAWDWAMGRNVLTVLGGREAIDGAILENYLTCAIVPPVGYTLLAWILSGSFVFTLACTFLLEACVLAAAGVVGLVLYRLFKWSDGAKDEGGVLAKVAAAVHDMTWWVDLKGGFSVLIGFALATYLLSPLVVFGTWASVSAYGGEGPEEFMATVALVYEYTFAIASELGWSPPSLTLDPSLVVGLPAFFGDFLVGLGDMPSADLFAGSQALDALASVIAFFKPAVCWLAAFLSMFDNLNVAENAAFALEAPVGLWEDEGKVLQTPEALASLGSADERRAAAEKRSKEGLLKRALESAVEINELLEDVSPQDVEGAAPLIESVRKIIAQGGKVVSRGEELLGGEGSGKGSGEGAKEAEGEVTDPLGASENEGSSSERQVELTEAAGQPQVV